MAEVTPEFSEFAAKAIGTDDPDRIAALKEAIVACFEEQESGGYEEEEESDEMGKGMGMGKRMGGLSTLFGGVK